MQHFTHKPFRGIISNWTKDNNRIYGRCEFHTFSEEEVARNGITVGQMMSTSSIVSVTVMGNNSQLVETNNSLYILVSNQK